MLFSSGNNLPDIARITYNQISGHLVAHKINHHTNLVELTYFIIMNSNECLEKILKKYSLAITGKLMVLSILSRGNLCSSSFRNDTDLTNHLKINPWHISRELTVLFLSFK